MVEHHQAVQRPHLAAAAAAAAAHSATQKQLSIRENNTVLLQVLWMLLHSDIDSWGCLFLNKAVLLQRPVSCTMLQLLC
jgi:hypothetical protein